MGVAMIPDSVDTRYKLQLKARHEMIMKLYQDILADMYICKIEGWDCLEYIGQLQEMINSLK